MAPQAAAHPSRTPIHPRNLRRRVSGGTTTRQPVQPLSPDQVTARAVAGGDADAFLALVDGHHTQLVRLAACHSVDIEQAEDIAREAWTTAIQRMAAFEGDRPLKVWLAAILLETARRRGGMPSAIDAQALAHTAALDDAFVAEGDDAGSWRTAPARWDGARIAGPDANRIVRRAIAALPRLQRKVITLRDIDGWTSDEVSALLAISELEQRRLLHRARTEVRAALDLYAAVDAVVA